MAEKLITLAKENTLHRVRRAVQMLGDKDAVRILFEEIAPSMKDRPGGYTRIVKLPTPRLGDKGQRVLFELVNFVPAASGEQVEQVEEDAEEAEAAS
jgi:large subunit ribosomal protein L17